MIPLLTGVLAAIVLAAVLALFLEAADAVFGNYGECEIDISGGDKSFTVKGGDKLLSTLMDQGIFVPSACGGRGSCGLCKVTVKEGGGPLLPTETPYLSEKERAGNVRLSCQVKVRQNLSIEIDPELFSIRQFRTRVAVLKDLTHNIKEVRLALKEPAEISFKPGQFIQFQVPPYPKSPEPVYRAYSMAGSASNNKEVLLCITRVPEGLATTYVHDHLKEGDEVIINGPYGEFYLRNSDAPMVMIATGSGLAPLLSLLHQLEEEKIPRKAALYFGVREKRDLFYVEELREFEKKLPGFRFVPVLSAPAEGDEWTGETGLVTDPVEKDLKKAPAGEAYLCGNPLMINAAVGLLQKCGIPENKIFYDKFA